MALPVLIFVTGPSGAGKSTFASRLSGRLKLPLFSTDIIKEWLYDSLGSTHEQIHEKLSAAGYDLLYKLVEEQLRVGNSLIVESVFWPQRNVKIFGAVLDRCPANVIEVHLTGDANGLFDRVLARDVAGSRHQGHGRKSEADRDEFVKAISEGSYGPLRLTEETLIVDTSDLNRVDFTDLERRISRFVENS